MSLALLCLFFVFFAKASLLQQYDEPPQGKKLLGDETRSI